MKFNTWIPGLALAACIAPAFAAEGWLTDLDEAKTQAAKDNKMVLIEFTGSDWCPPCMALKKTVLSTSEFLDAAKKNFVLVELDYPRNKAQTPELKKKNQEEAELYNIEGFPTIVFADAQGRPVQVIVGGRDKSDVLKAMEEAVKKEAEISAAMKKAEAAQGDAKIAELGSVLKMVPEGYVDKFYSDVVDELVKLDVHDKSGMKALRNKENALKQEEQKMYAFLSGLKQDPKEAQAKIEEYLKTEKLLPETKQQMMSIICNIKMEGEDLDGALATMEEAEKLAPKSKLGEQLAMQRRMIIERKDEILKMIEERKKLKEASKATGK